MNKQRKTFTADFKAKVALEAIKGQKTINELASLYALHPNQITQWKKQLLEAVPTIFADKRARENRERDELEATLYQQIGQLKVELDWLKKKSGLVAR